MRMQKKHIILLVVILSFGIILFPKKVSRVFKNTKLVSFSIINVDVGHNPVMNSNSFECDIPENEKRGNELINYLSTKSYWAIPIRKKQNMGDWLYVFDIMQDDIHKSVTIDVNQGFICIQDHKYKLINWNYEDVKHFISTSVNGDGSH